MIINETLAKKVAYRYSKDNTGDWCRIYYACYLMDNLTDLKIYIRILKGI